MSTCPQCGSSTGHAPGCPVTMGFADLVVQSTQMVQLSSIHQQLNQIATIQVEQLRLQQMQVLEQQRQAALQQILFEQERFVHSLDQLSSVDRFAGALYAALRLNAINAAQLGPEQFVAIEHKRSFQAATDQMRALLSGLEAQGRDLAGATITALDQYFSWERDLAGQGRSEILSWEKQAKAESANAASHASLAKLSFRIGAGFALLAVGLVVAGAAVNLDHLLAVSTFAWLGAIVLFIVGFNRGGVRDTHEQDARRLRTAATDLRTRIAQFIEWIAQPRGGQLLRTVADEHPILRALPGLDKLPGRDFKLPELPPVESSPAPHAAANANSSGPSRAGKKFAFIAAGSLLAVVVAAVVVVVAVQDRARAARDPAETDSNSSDTRCKDTPDCRHLGYCTAKGADKCVAGTDEDCKQSVICKEDGFCRVNKAVEWCVR